MRIDFGEWLPDQADLVTGVTRAWNLLPTAGPGYEVSPGFALTELPVVPQEPLLIRAFYAADGTLQTFAFCKTKIYRFDGTVWADASRTGDYTWSTGTQWSVVKWGDTIYATNYNQPLQSIALNETKFIDVVTGLANGMRCKFLLVIRDFLVCINCADVSAAGIYPYRMHWSGRLRPNDFLPSLSTMAGFRDVPDIGALVGGTGGDFGLILGTRGLVRVDYLGAPAVWQVSVLDLEIGCALVRSIVKLGGITYWYSSKGWRLSEGGPSKPFGLGKIDRYFSERLNLLATQDNMSVFVLPTSHIIGWSYVTNDSADQKTNALLYFNPASGFFSEARCDFICYGTFATSGPFVDDPVYGELLTDSTDTLSDPQGGDGVPQVIGIDRTFNIHTITKFDYEFEIVTREFELAPNRRSRVTRVRLLGEGEVVNYEAKVSSRDRQPPSTLASDPWVASEPTGSVSADKRGRYHRVAITGQGNMPTLFAVDVTGVPVGTK